MTIEEIDFDTKIGGRKKTGDRPARGVPEPTDDEIRRVISAAYQRTAPFTSRMLATDTGIDPRRIGCILGREAWPCQPKTKPVTWLSKSTQTEDVPLPPEEELLRMEWKASNPKRRGTWDEFKARRRNNAW